MCARPSCLPLARSLVLLSLGLPALCRAADAPGATAPASGQDGASGPGRPASEPVADPRPDEPRGRDETFRKLVTNVKLTGHFTIDGREEAKLQEEEYVITGATKLGAGDLWALNARIKYGERDVTVPVPVQVKWAGDTPVITLDNVGIPGLGTFSARVVLDQDRYAGTWRHDRVGGHLFGRIAPAAAAEAEKPPRSRDRNPTPAKPDGASVP